MREILFRGKRLDNGMWMEGYYMYHISRTPAPIGDSVKPEDEHHLIIFDEFSDWNMPRGIKYVEVDASTVGQYTGLTDKHGNRIFEGDIVKTDKYGTGDGQGRNLEVAVEYGGFCLRDGWRRYNLRPDDGIEVIGNIYDNPELLGGEKGE